MRSPGEGAATSADPAGTGDGGHDPLGPGVVELEIPARTDYVSLVRLVVATAAELDPGLATERIDDLRIAVSEATTNAITASGSEHRIRVRCDLAADEIAVVVHDEGTGFDPGALPGLPEPDDPDRLQHENGLGVPLMRMLADEAEISSGVDGTDVRLVVYSSRRRRG